MIEDFDELDQLIRERMLAATEPSRHVDAHELARTLQIRRTRIDSDSSNSGSPMSSEGARRRRGRLWLSAAAVVIVISGVIGALIVTNHEPERHVVTGPAQSTTTSTRPDLGGPEIGGFGAWGPGWHELDLGPLLRGSAYSTAWYDSRLIIAVNGFTAVGDAGWTTAIWSFDPGTRDWTELPAPELTRVQLVPAGDQLVAVGLEWSGEPGDPRRPLDRWATWTAGDARWEDHGVIPLASPLETMGVAPMGSDGSNLLVWTGRALLDFTRGAVLDPENGNTRTLELPDDVGQFAGLLGTEPVWTGAEVVWPGPIGDSGLLWSANGELVGRVPAGPAGSGERFHLTSRVFMAADRVVVVDSFPTRADVSEFDPRTETWRQLAPIENLPVPGCLGGVTLSDGRLLIVPCATDDRAEAPILLDRGEWTTVSPLPDAAALTSATRDVSLTPAGDSVVLLSALMPGDWVHDDRSTDQFRPRAAVWVPERKDGSVPRDSDTASFCDVEGLPDVTRLLPPSFDRGPKPGMGGGGGPNPTCARHWGVSGDPGTHVTQIAGPSALKGPTIATIGDNTLSAIEDGWAIEHGGTPSWTLLIYGAVSESEVKAIFEGVARPG